MTSSGPYGSDPYASWGESDPSRPGADPSGPDPYGTDPAGSDPYAAGPQDPLAAPGFSPGGFVPVHSGPQFGDHGGYAPVPAPPPSSAAAIAGFVLGLLSVTLCAGLTAPVGLIFSLRGMRESGPRAHPPAGGYGLAIAGLVTSIIGCLTLLAVIAYLAFVALVLVLGSTAA